MGEVSYGKNIKWKKYQLRKVSCGKNIKCETDHVDVSSGETGCMLNGRPVARGECISSRASGTPVTTSPAGE